MQKGGAAYKQSPGLELVSLLLTSFASDAAYKTAGQQLARLESLLNAVDPLFAAKALVFARDEFGMRSVTHAGGALLAKRVSGTTWGTDFYKALVVRPDDMTEVLAFCKSTKNPITKAMRKGFALAMADMNQYQLAKYRGEGKGFKMVDVANLVHPKPNVRSAAGLKALMHGELKSEQTWESMLSASGSDAAKKAEVWNTLLSENKLGYFALLRNLRNIAQQAPASLDLALEQLKDPTRIGKSRVLPFRYHTAYSELIGQGIPRERDILWSIDEAADMALANVTKFDGDTLIALDTSGSMQGRPIQIGAMFAAVLARTNKADLLTFSDRFTWNQVERMGVLPMSRSITNLGGGTNFNCVFVAAKRKYDRIIILSDGEAWMGPNASQSSLKEYRNQYDANPQIWFFDLSNQSGTMQFPEGNTRVIAGFSEKVFELMPLIEKDPNALVKRVSEHGFKKSEVVE